jgi:hypothetical protein
MSESYLDRPQDDGTHKAHPAYNRGKVAGVKVMISIITNIINSTDKGQGVNISPQVEATRRALLKYKDVLESLTEAKNVTTASNCTQALKEAEKLVASIKF